MSLPFDIKIGDVILHDDRRIRFDGDQGEGELNFVDVRTGKRLRVRNPLTGEMGPPTCEWVRRELMAGRLKRPVEQRSPKSDRRGDLSGCDSDACIALDPKSSWRDAWIRAAVAADMAKTDAAYRAFIKANATLVAKRHEEAHGRAYKAPGASTLKRWVRDKPEGYAPEHNVSRAGRQKGQSQLSVAEDLLVHEAAVYYWATPGASIRDAHALMAVEWDDLEGGDDGKRGDKAPSYEAVRLRAHSLATYDTALAKFGKERADRWFGATGESVPTTRAGERVYFDGTEFEQICVFGENWQLAGSKVRGVFGIDGFSTFIFDPAIFAGPYREETSIQALCQVMTPPEHLSPEQLAEDEHVGWTFLIPETCVADNDRVVIGPGYVPALLDLGSRLELPKTYHHDAKALVEWLFRWLKARMRHLPGTVLSPRHPKDIRQDPVAGAELTMAQIRTIIRSLVWEYNHTAVARLNWRSPYEVLKASMMAKGAASLTDPNRIWCELGKTVPGCVMTDDGVEYDGVDYRGPEVGEFLRRNFHATPLDERNPSSAKCIVTIRTVEADIDYIRVWDDDAQDFIRLFSTQPSYTAGLSRWEHDKYRQLAKQRRERFDTEGERVRSRAKSLREIDEQAPNVAFRRRAVMTALVQSEDVRHLSGARARNPRFATLPEHFVLIEPMTAIRGGPGVPPPGPKSEQEPKKPSVKQHAPKRPDGWGTSSREREAEEPGGGTGLDWAALGTEVPDDLDDDD